MTRSDAPTQVHTVMDNGTTLVQYPTLGDKYNRLERWHSDRTWRINEHNSIFTRRRHLRDITISVINPAGWGAIYDGVAYNSVCTLACEDGHVVRGRIEAVPQEILDNLITWGFTFPGGLDNE